MKVTSHKWMLEKTKRHIKEVFPKAKNFKFEAGIFGIRGHYEPYFECFFHANEGDLIRAFWHNGELEFEFVGSVHREKI